MIRDIIQFGAIFAVFLFSFSGALYLALRGEVHYQMESDCAGGGCNFTNTTTAQNESTLVPALNTSLNIHHYETSYVKHSSIANKYSQTFSFRIPQ